MAVDAFSNGSGICAACFTLDVILWLRAFGPIVSGSAKREVADNCMEQVGKAKEKEENGVLPLLRYVEVSDATMWWPL